MKIEMLIGTVKYILLTLKNGQRVVRDRAVLRSEKGKIFVDSVQAENIKILGEDRESGGDENFAIIISILKNVNLPQKFIIQIGDAVIEAEKVAPFEFEVRRILKGGFVKSGNDVLIVNF